MAHEKVYFSDKNYYACGWKCEMLSCIWKKLQYLRLSPACSKITWTRVKVGKTRLLPLVQPWTQEQAFNWFNTRRVSHDKKLLRFTSLRWPQPSLLSKRALLYCMLALFEHFYKKASHHKQETAQLVFSVVVLLLKYNFILHNVSLYCVSSKNSLGWEFVYVATCFVGI